MVESTPSAALDLAWQRQSVWSQVAARLKSQVQRSRERTLKLSICGAVFAAVAVGVGVKTTPGTVLSILGAVSIALIPIVRSLSDKDSVADWARARSVSETLKSEVFLYLTGTGSYAGTTRDDELVHNLDRIEQDASDLLRHALGTTPESRGVPPVRDLTSYVAERVTRQLDAYYRPAAVRLERRARYVRNAELALAAAGAILAAVASALGADAVAVWVPVATTASAAITAHAAAERYEYLLVEYLRTASELERLRRRLGGAGDLTPEEFVRACERVISLQNEGWMAKLTSDVEAAA